MNAAFERPISAAHSKFGGRVPDGVLVDKVVADTVRMVQRYVKRDGARRLAERCSSTVENYARTINSFFTQYKPHDDRHPEEGRRNALYSAFYVLKNLMIMLYPFVPSTMERLRESLRLAGPTSSPSTSSARRFRPATRSGPSRSTSRPRNPTEASAQCCSVGAAVPAGLGRGGSEAPSRRRNPAPVAASRRAPPSGRLMSRCARRGPLRRRDGASLPPLSRLVPRQSNRQLRLFVAPGAKRR